MSTLHTDIDSCFAEDGALSSREGYEFRPQQREMARAVADALAGPHHLIVEAPTGVGKTLAYLVPALLHTRRTGERVVISTHTKNLQEQLLRKDLPLALQTLGIRVDAAVLKGRRNYCCTTRLRNALAASASLFPHALTAELERIAAWAATAHERTLEGTLEELTPPPDPDAWSVVCSEREICTPRSCGTECFYQRARERTRTAGIVVLNHALFFTLLSMQDADDAYVFNSRAVIFDEAHVLESVAGAGIGRRVTAAQFRAALRRLYNPSTRKGIVAKNAPEAKRAVSAAAEAVDRFFGEIGAALRAMEEGGGLIRIRVPEIVADTLSEPLASLHSRLEKLESAGTLTTHAQQELTVVRRTIGEAHAMVEEFIHQTDPLLTYWCEQAAGKNDRIALCASPADVSGLVGPRLFRDGTSAILTSATLAAGGKMDYYRIRIGALDVPVLTLDSPFNHWRQMRLCIARDISEPDDPEYQEELPEWILRAVDRSAGRALVLFTSNAMMRAIAKRVAPAFEERGFRLLVQGIDGPRHTLLEEFRRDIHSVLFGLDSFWMGVDVPGEALEHVIITRLPFSMPNHPLVEARIEAITREGGNPFLEYSLPEALLKFRQGAGRLLRSKSDRGLVTVLDSRILRKSYGRAFLASLPRCPVELFVASGEHEEITPEEAE